MTAARNALRAAYRAAIYRVVVGGRHYDLRCGMTDSAMLDALCDAAGVRRHWAILTPYNPASTLSPVADNRRHLQQLDADVRHRGIVAWPTLHLDAEGVWPVERGLMLCDPPARWAMALARNYGQHAYVVGGRGRRPQLRWYQPVTLATG